MRGRRDSLLLIDLSFKQLHMFHSHWIHTLASLLHFRGDIRLDWGPSSRLNECRLCFLNVSRVGLISVSVSRVICGTRVPALVLLLLREVLLFIM